MPRPCDIEQEMAGKAPIDEHEGIVAVEHRLGFLTDQAVTAEDRGREDIGVMINLPARYRCADLTSAKQLSIDHVAYLWREGLEARGLFLRCSHSHVRVTFALVAPRARRK